MPIQTCMRSGRKGYRYGRQGKCYLGKGARVRAGRQGRAIKVSQSKGMT